MQENTKGAGGQVHRNDDDQNSGAGAAGARDNTHMTQDQGGTVDMGSEGFQEATGTSRLNTGSSENSTKKSVTGSDFDGQVA